MINVAVLRRVQYRGQGSLGQPRIGVSAALEPGPHARQVALAPAGYLELCIQRQGEANGDYPYGHYEEGRILNPKFWNTRRALEAIHHIEAFASRFAVNDPLRTCDSATLRQTLIGVLHYSFEVFAKGGRDYGPWVR